MAGEKLYQKLTLLKSSFNFDHNKFDALIALQYWYGRAHAKELARSTQPYLYQAGLGFFEKIQGSSAADFKQTYKKCGGSSEKLLKPSQRTNRRVNNLFKGHSAQHAKQHQATNKFSHSHR